MNLDTLTKTQRLLLSLVMDAIGIIPFIDLVWAPFSAYVMTKLYKGTPGKYAAVFTFIEEAIPGTDFIPSFTIMWFITYVFGREETGVIEVD